MRKLLYIKTPGFIIARIIYKLQLFLFRKIIQSKNAWRLFDETGIEGFGVNLIRLYFPIYYDHKANRDSFSVKVKNEIIELFKEHTSLNEYEESIRRAIPRILKLTLNEENTNWPYLDNHYFGVFDAAILSAIMQSFRPAKLVEIGSGISTRYIKLFKDEFALTTEIICIDPYPRAEIKGVADVMIQLPLEDAVENSLFSLQSGDILFMDGSHYVFQGNDTLTFFFKILPSLPTGVIIHIHDIYLPFDYAQNVTQQLWTEQYILVSMLLSGLKDYEILYPAYYMSQTNDVIINELAEANRILKNKDFKLSINHKAGFSFWMRKR